jgi:hypothetical protein
VLPTPATELSWASGLWVLAQSSQSFQQETHLLGTNKNRLLGMLWYTAA